MITQTIKIIGQCRVVVAMAQIFEKGEQFVGMVDLRTMPNPLRQIFEEYERIVNNQMFSFLDEIEDQIDALELKVIFRESYEAAVQDLQIYPNTNRISFKIVKKPVQNTMSEIAMAY